MASQEVTESKRQIAAINVIPVLCDFKNTIEAHDILSCTYGAAFQEYWNNGGHFLQVTTHNCTIHVNDPVQLLYIVYQTLSTGIKRLDHTKKTKALDTKGH
jgi:hypothetical protein